MFGFFKKLREAKMAKRLHKLELRQLEADEAAARQKILSQRHAGPRGVKGRSLVDPRRSPGRSSVDDRRHDDADDGFLMGVVTGVAFPPTPQSFVGVAIHNSLHSSSSSDSRSSDCGSSRGSSDSSSSSTSSSSDTSSSYSSDCSSSSSSSFD